MSLFSIDVQKCKRDGLCAAECPMGLIDMQEEGFPNPVPSAEELCVNCGHCVAVCPHGALALKTMKPEDCPSVNKQLILTPEHAEHFLRYRRSIRNYRSKPVDRGVIGELIRMASYAPSGHNLQPVHWLAIDDPAELSRLAGLVIGFMRMMIKDHPEVAGPMHFDRVVNAWEKGFDRILRGAPNVLVAHGVQSLGTAQPSSIIALTYLELAATSLGLGTCWAGYFNAAATFYPPMMEALALPQGHQSFGAMMVGYPKYVYQRLPLRNAPKIRWR
ncbi:MAG TPA: nitroreductase family protein [Desulfomonilaceae bacterium]|nr:nitroreductase family protein [Desulfomonilaceae bacterium]